MGLRPRAGTALQASKAFPYNHLFYGFEFSPDARFFTSTQANFHLRP